MGYIPRQEAKLLTWAQNFAARIAENPGRYGLTPADAGRITAVVNEFAAAYAAAGQGPSRTAAAVAAKKAASARMLPVLRGYAMPIKHRHDVSDTDKLSLGLRLNPRSRTQPAAPTSWPVVSLREGQPLRHKLQFVDSGAEGRKPAGATRLELVYRLSDPAARASSAPGMEGSRLAALVTRPAFTMVFKPEEAGRLVHYWARWQTRTGKTGPWSPVLRISVMG